MVENKTGVSSYWSNWNVYTSGTSFSGGSGGGGYTYYGHWYSLGGSIDTYAGNGASPGYYSYDTWDGGWSGRKYAYFYTGGSAGNPAGKNYSSPGQDGTGGVIILVVHGKFVVNLKASITSNGSQAGKTYRTGEPVTYYTTGVGNSGGGSINIFLKNLDYTNYRNYSSKWSFCFSDSSKWKWYSKYRQVLDTWEL